MGDCLLPASGAGGEARTVQAAQPGRKLGASQSAVESLKYDQVLPSGSGGGGRGVRSGTVEWRFRFRHSPATRAAAQQPAPATSIVVVGT